MIKKNAYRNPNTRHAENKTRPPPINPKPLPELPKNNSKSLIYSLKKKTTNNTPKKPKRIKTKNKTNNSPSTLKKSKKHLLPRKQNHFLIILNHTKNL